MEIVRIFGEKLFAFKYPDQTEDEFSRLFDLWNDAEYLLGFFETHISDLQSGYWGDISVENAANKTFYYSQKFKFKLTELSRKSENEHSEGLETIFSYLHNSQQRMLPFNRSKAKDNWLRIYALRIEKDIYIITGGAIKLTRTMQDNEHTNNEFLKIEKCRQYLIDLGIVDVDGLIEEIVF